MQRREPARAELLKRAQEFLDGQQKVLGLLHEAAGMPGCRYTVDWTRDEHGALEERLLGTARTGVEDSGFLQQGVRGSVRLLCLEALVAASSGRADEALVALRDAVRMTRTLDDLPMLMTHLVIVACSNMILDTAEYVLYTSGLDSEWRVKLAGCIEPLRNEDALRRAYVGERCFGITFTRGPRSDRVPPDWPAYAVVLVLAYDAAGFGRADSVAYLKDMEQQIAVAELPPSGRAQAFETNRADFERRPSWRTWFNTNMANAFLLCEPDAKLLSRVAAVQEALKG